MKEKKELVFVMKVMSGGGAERVISLLTSAAVKRNYDVTLLITHQKKSDSVLRDIDPRINVLSLSDEVAKTDISWFAEKMLLLCARILGKFGKLISEKIFYKSLVLKYFSYNFNNICWMKKYFRKHSDAVVIAFLYDSIFYSLLSVSRKNRLIISERGDPCQSLSSKTTVAFLKNEFQHADAFVFQSPDVKKWYEENTKVNGTVIFNPIKAGLPEAYTGERQKKIVNFCRISSQKNLILLLDAFEIFYKIYPEYELYIYGDPVGNDSADYLDKVNNYLLALECKEKVFILPSKKDIHEEIIDYTMFVSSSDFEGMSNSMLEAMSLGLPCVCTDCPAGGARAVIKDGENGLLVPANDADALGNAMIKVVSEQGLSEKLSLNASLIKNSQSLEKITEKWMSIING